MQRVLRDCLNYRAIFIRNARHWRTHDHATRAFNRKRMIHRTLGFIMPVILAGCAQSELESQPYQPDYSHGMALYEGKCGSCHDNGKKNAPSIKDPEEWDIQTLTNPGIVEQHRRMRFLGGVDPVRLSQYDEADVLFYIHQEIGDREASY